MVWYTQVYAFNFLSLSSKAINLLSLLSKGWEVIWTEYFDTYMNKRYFRVSVWDGHGKIFPG